VGYVQRDVSSYVSWGACILTLILLCLACRLDYAGPEILRGEAYKGPPQDVWAFGIVSYVLVVGECPFSSALEAAAGLSQGSKALAALEERCGQLPPSNSPSLMDGLPPVLYPPPSPPSSECPAEPPAALWSNAQLDFTEFFAPKYDAEREQLKMDKGMEKDGGGSLGDAMALIKACLQLDVARRPSFDEVLMCRYLSGHNGWADIDDISRC
jgi:protein-serine/threonine kinase